MEGAGTPAGGAAPEPRIGDAMGRGWRTLWANFWPLLGPFLLYVLAQAVGNLFQVRVGPEDPFQARDVLLGGAGGLYSLFVLAPLSVGVYWMFLRTVRGNRPRVGDLGAGFHRYFETVALMFLGFLLVVGGLILLIVPGIILFVRLSMAPLLYMDRGLGPTDALRASWELTRGHGWRLFGLYLLAIPVLVLGALALLVGLLPAGMLMLCAYASYYEALVQRGPTASPAPPPGVAPGAS